MSQVKVLPFLRGGTPVPREWEEWDAITKLSRQFGPARKMSGQPRSVPSWIKICWVFFFLIARHSLKRYVCISAT